MHTRRRKISESDGFTIVVDDQTNPPTNAYPEKEKYPTSWKFQFGQQLQQFSNKVTSVVAPIPQQLIGSSQGPPPVVSSIQAAPKPVDSDDEKEKYVGPNPGRDRMPEFMSSVRLLQGRNVQRIVNIREPKQLPVPLPFQEFLNLANVVGRNYANTKVKLKKLKLLVKQKSLFDDRSAEINELTHIIKTDLASLNQQIARLQEICKNQARGCNNQVQKHSLNMVVALQTRLANLSTTFKRVLELRTENLKQQKQRRDEFTSQPGPTSWSGAQSSLLLEEEAAASGYDSDVQRLLPHNQQLMMRNNQAHYQERADSMKNIESTIVELGGIFQQLASLVKEQEEIVERIDTNVMDMEMNVGMAHTEILKYFQSVTKNRAFMIKIFIVLIVLFLFFYFFMS